WIETERGEGRPPSQDKATSWAVSALQQSRGSWLMEVSGPTKPSMLDSPVWAATPGGGTLPDAADAVTLMIGPEGGLTPDELEVAEAQVSLGKLTLRTETAALVLATLALQASGRVLPDA
ncbi:MAG: 16S rRNA (uracil(1498)-N(3))-methyltransferase, partial [Acidimicrobiia bacterium]|nr:16S rRNA (uracil(1498)-N(3))-methyltransferase [Acidimicrobiia bacterium]